MAKRRPRSRMASLLLAVFMASGCASGGNPPASGPGDSVTGEADRAEADRQLLSGTPNGAWESSYEPLASNPVLIRGGTIMTAAGEEIEGGDVLLVDGRIKSVGVGLDAPAGTAVIEADGRFVTPGIIDTHSHLGG